MAAFIDNKKTKLTHHLTDTFCRLSEHRSSATTGSAVFLPFHRLISSYFSTIREIFILVGFSFSINFSITLILPLFWTMNPWTSATILFLLPPFVITSFKYFVCELFCVYFLPPCDQFRVAASHPGVGRVVLFPSQFVV